MNAEDFYISLKDALNYLGVSWGDKELVTVSIVNGNAIKFSYGNKSCVIEMKS